jgi:hypothetical protein
MTLASCWNSGGHVFICQSIWWVLIGPSILRLFVRDSIFARLKSHVCQQGKMASWMNVPENIQRTPLDHILHNILRLQNDPNEPVHVALNRARVRTLNYLVERPTADIDALTCQPAGNDANGQPHAVQDLEDHLKLQLKQVIAHILEENTTFEILGSAFNLRGNYRDTITA